MVGKNCSIFCHTNLTRGCSPPKSDSAVKTLQAHGIPKICSFSPSCSVQKKGLEISNNLNTIFNSSSQSFSHCRYLNQLKEDDSLCRQAQTSGTFYLFHNLSPFLQKAGKKYLVPQLSAAGKKGISASRKKHMVDHTAEMKRDTHMEST